MAATVTLRIRVTPATALPGDEPALLETGSAGSLGGRSGVLMGEARVADGIDVVEVVVGGWRFELEIEPAARAELRERATRGRPEAAGIGPLEIHAIIPGRVVSLAVSTGDAVTAGQPLLVLEAMKMQNELRAPRAGRVGRVVAAPGATVELGDVLLVLE